MVEALDGRFEPHHRFLLRFELRRLTEAEHALAELDAHIQSKMLPYEPQVGLLVQIPGIDRVLAASIIAELGVDMSVFPSANHAAAWAGACPGSNESGGKRRHAGARKGNIHLLTALVQAAITASHKRGCYFRDKYWRLRARRGPKRAAVAVARKILVVIYHLLRDGHAYADLGGDYLKRRAAPQSKRTLVKQLEALGYTVTLERTPT